MRSEYQRVAEYLHLSWMQYAGSWPKEVEIQAAVDCLEVSIFKYYDDRLNTDTNNTNS